VVRDPEGVGEAALLVSVGSRTLRRQLRALAWMTLEEVALAAVPEGGRLIAQTSARQVAEHLAVEPETVAGALRVLRNRGLLALEREQGPASRFGLSVYVLGSVAGLAVIAPGAAFPGTGAPSLGVPEVIGPPSSPSLQRPTHKAFDLGTASS
jgi:DNA-binding transcriptional ArsR family regulator